MLVELDQLPTIRREHKHETIVIRAGCYDLLHEGHTHGLHFSKSLGDILVAGVWSDIRVQERKGLERPIRPEISRAILVGELGMVDYSIIMPLDDEEDPSMIKVMKLLQPDIFVVAESQLGHPNDRMIEEELGVRIVPYSHEPLGSTTEIINTIRQRYTHESA